MVISKTKIKIWVSRFRLFFAAPVDAIIMPHRNVSRYCASGGGGVGYQSKVPGHYFTKNIRRNRDLPVFSHADMHTCIKVGNTV